MRRFVILFLLLKLSCLAESRIDCNALNSKILRQTVHYCVLLPSGYEADKSATFPVLYFLHGLGENEQTLFKTGGWTLVQDLEQQKKISPFLIVTPEAKASFYVNSANGKVLYSDFLMREFIPFIEKSFRVREGRPWRAISGISMGGYGALRFAFAFPQMFSAVSAESAALLTSSPQQLDAAMRTGSPIVRLLGPVFGNPISVAHWNKNNPFTLAKENRVAIRKLAIYFNCGRNDEYQFEDGAEALDRLLSQEKVKHEYYLYPGNHTASYFLEHLGEVLQFHSKNFGTRGR
jgi:S-formylglutathione hydrolase FrmB